MTVASINSTVSVVVASELGLGSVEQYTPAITKVTEALTTREYDIVDAVAERANTLYGVSKRDVANILHDAGLAQRPAPVAVPVPPVVEDEDDNEDEAAGAQLSKKSKGQRIADLEQGQVAILEALGELKSLAQRHLGASL